MMTPLQQAQRPSKADFDGQSSGAGPIPDMRDIRHAMSAALRRELRLEKLIREALNDLEEGNQERAKIVLKAALAPEGR